MTERKRFKFTQEQVEFIINKYMIMELSDLLIAFNKRFNTDLIKQQIKNKIQQIGICKRNIKDNYGKYTIEMVDWLSDNFNKIKLDILVETFNKKFNTDFTKSSIWHKAERIMGAEFDRTREYVPRLVWTKELIEYLKKHYDELSYKKLSDIMNNRFNIKTTPSSIEHKVNRLGLKKSEEGLNKSRNLKAASLFWFQK